MFYNILAGGAMRIPLQEHFMTKHYIDVFSVQMRNFDNFNDKAYINLFGTNIRLSGMIRFYVNWRIN